MAVRSGMVYLLDIIRQLISDPAGGDQQFDDQHIQDILDRHRTDANYVILTPVERISPGGSVTYLDFESEARYWEGTPTLLDGNFSPLIPSSVDLVRGKFSFGSEPTRPVYALGSYYEIYHTSADLLLEWASSLHSLVDYQDADQRIFFSQRRKNLLQTAELMRSLAPPVQASGSRGDSEVF